jgi:hypothetical protein
LVLANGGFVGETADLRFAHCGNRVLSKNSHEAISCGFSKVVPQQPTESFPAIDGAFLGKLGKLGPDDLVVQSLVIALLVIM